MDRVVFDVVSDPEVILLKTVNGEYDMQFQYGTKPKNKPVFARNRSRGHYGFVEMTNTSMNDMVIALNLTHKDEVIREIFGQKQLRTGLSRAINRDKIIDSVYQRQGDPYQSAPRPESDYYDEELARQYTDYNPGAASKDLDAVLPEKDADGWRLRPDGKRLSVAVEVVSDRPWWVDSLELIKGFWKAVGVEMTVKAEDRSLWAERSAANDHDALVWTGDAGLRDGLLYPAWYFPYNSGSRYAVPWAEWYESGGETGQRPPSAPLRQMRLYDEFRRTIDADKRKQLFTEILAIAKEQFYTIGTVLPGKKYGIVKNDLDNVPDSFYYGWVYHFCGPTRCEQYSKSS